MLSFRTEVTAFQQGVFKETFTRGHSLEFEQEAEQARGGTPPPEGEPDEGYGPILGSVPPPTRHAHTSQPVAQLPGFAPGYAPPLPPSLPSNDVPAHVQQQRSQNVNFGN